MSKYLEDLRDRHTGEDVWVIGAGPSLDDYPINFFKDKICIGVNFVFSVFLNIGDGKKKFDTRAFYSVHSHAEPALWIARHIPQFLTNCFLISRPQAHRKSRGRSYCCPQDFNEDPYWIRNSYLISDVKASDTDFKVMAECIMAGRENCRYCIRGTSLHWAMEVAVVLGAKKIYIVGGAAQGGRMRKHGSLYQSTRLPLGEGSEYPQWRTGTKRLAEVFRPYGIKIAYYYYGTGERAP